MVAPHWGLCHFIRVPQCSLAPESRPLHSSPTASFPLPRVDAGKVELDGASYAGLSLPFSITQLIWIEVILVGGAELYRNGELDTEKRVYPGEQSSSVASAPAGMQHTQRSMGQQAHW